MASASASAAPAEVGKFFADIASALARHPELVAQVGGLFHFIIKGPTPAATFSYLVNLKHAPGGVTPGALPRGTTADCSIEYSSAASFVAINAGKLDLKQALIMRRLKVRRAAVTRSSFCLHLSRSRAVAELAAASLARRTARSLPARPGLCCAASAPPLCRALLLCNCARS